MLFKGKSLRLVTPQETPRHPHAALKGASGLLRDSSKSYGFHCRALKVFLWFHAALKSGARTARLAKVVRITLSSFKVVFWFLAALKSGARTAVYTGKVGQQKGPRLARLAFFNKGKLFFSFKRNSKARKARKAQNLACRATRVGECLKKSQQFLESGLPRHQCR